MLALKYDVELGKALKGDNSKIKNKVVDNAMKLLDDEEIVLKELMQASAELLNAKSC
jgi:hypothetical protein